MNLDRANEKFDTLSFIMAFEGGEIETEDELLEGFQHLVDSGLAWQLQGSYGRAAAAMIEAGMIADPRQHRQRLRSSLVAGFESYPDACPLPPDGDEIQRLATALSKLPKLGETQAQAAERVRAGTLGRVYGGDPALIHIKDGTRADVGADLATALESMMRANALADGTRTAEAAMSQDLCPGCYMVALYDAAVTLAQRNGQSLLELSRSMAQAFSLLAERLDNPFTEEIEVLLDSEPTQQPTVSEWNAAKHNGFMFPHMEAI